MSSSAAGPVVPLPFLKELLAHAVKSGASDVHLSAGEPPIFRIHGNIQRVFNKPLDKKTADALIDSILNPEQKEEYEKRLEIDFCLQVQDLGRFRANIFNQIRGKCAVFRVISSKIRSMDELNLPPVVKVIAKLEKGLVLVTGPTGSGKSTTLAAIIDHINETRQGHILTVEDPVEFIHPPKKCIVNQREVGLHTHSFANSLKSALREDPDVILVGEMRDLETISLALTAAETGHLVFGTLHTSSAAKTIDRIIDVFPASQQNQIRMMLSESIRAVIAQILLPTVDHKGRVAAHEIMISTSAIKNLIRENKLQQVPTIMQTGIKLGMQTMEQAVRNLLVTGKISKETAAELGALTNPTTPGGQ
jgi:twitching motility protein PilT